MTGTVLHSDDLDLPNRLSGDAIPIQPRWLTHRFVSFELHDSESCMIFNFADACFPGAVGAAIKGIISLDTVSDDLASTVITYWREFVDRALKTVEGVACARCYDLKRQIIIVATHFTFRHA